MGGALTKSVRVQNLNVLRNKKATVANAPFSFLIYEVHQCTLYVYAFCLTSIVKKSNFFQYYG